MKLLVPLFILFLSNIESRAVTSMKLEGSCSGTLLDTTPLHFDYYSDFDGCKRISSAAISLKGSLEGVSTGIRYFKSKLDVYDFKDQYQIIFLNSTGNTTGKFRYFDADKKKHQTIEVRCDVRDYEFADC